MPKARDHIAVQAIDPALIKFAAQAKKLSVELRQPIMNVIERARLDGVLECDDEQAFAIAYFADRLKGA